MHRLASPATTLAVLFGLLTALSNAVAVTAQHVASQRERGRRHGWARLRFVLRQPLWWAGGLGLVGSLLFQALALNFGSLSLVQPLLISEIVLALVLRRLFAGQSISPASWWAGSLTVLALGLFLILAHPGRGSTSATPAAWREVLVGAASAMALLVVVAVKRSERVAAGCWGTITAIAWALEATLIRSTTQSIVGHGYLGALTHWPLYGFALVGIIGLAAEQTALHVGPLSVAQSCIVIVDPLVSILFGVLLFHEAWPRAGATLGASIAALVVVMLGAGVLMRTVPEVVITPGPRATSD